MSNGSWKVGQAEFQGYVKATLEELKEEMRGVRCQTAKNTREIDNAKGMAKGAMIAGGVGGAGGFLSFIKEFFMR